MSRRPAGDTGSQTRAGDPHTILVEPLLTAAELADWLGVSEATIRDWRVDGKGPPAVKLGTGRMSAVRWTRRDVEAWLQAAREAS